MSVRKSGQPLWLVRVIRDMVIDHSTEHLFAGSETEMLRYINALELKTGNQYSATSSFD